MWYLTKYKNISTTVIRLKAQNLEISFTAFWYFVYILQINIYAYTCTFYIPFEIISRAFKWAITLHLLWPQGPSPVLGLNCMITRKKIHLKQTGQLWNIGLFIFHSYVEAAIIGEGLQILTNTRHSWPLSMQWGFFIVPHLLWHGTSVYNGHIRGLVVERLVVQLYLSVWMTKVCRCWDSNTSNLML